MILYFDVICKCLIFNFLSVYGQRSLIPLASHLPKKSVNFAPLSLNLKPIILRIFFPLIVCPVRRWFNFIQNRQQTRQHLIIPWTFACASKPIGHCRPGFFYSFLNKQRKYFLTHTTFRTLVALFIVRYIKRQR